MCKLIVAATKKVGDPEFIKTIQAQYEDLTEKDGLSAVVIAKSKIYVFRELLAYESVFDRVNDLLPNASFVGIHSRQSTGGTTCAANVHFFEKDGWLLAHNGTIPKLSVFRNQRWNFHTKEYEDTTPNQDDQCEDCFEHPEFMCDAHNPQKNKQTEGKKFKACDSLQFLHKIPKPVTVDSFAAAVDEYDANGMIVMIEKKTGTVLLHVGKVVYAITDKKGFCVFTSFKPTEELKQEKWFSFLGVPVFDKKSSSKLAYPARDVSLGTFKLDY